MKKTNKKGFTIVELVIVIAVIAILAAVLIPTFANIIDKANKSADQQAVAQMNKVLKMEEVTDEPENVIEVAQLLIDNGYSNNFIPYSKSYKLAWIETDNVIVLVENGKVAYPENYKGQTNFEDLVKIATSYADINEIIANGSATGHVNIMLPEDLTFTQSDSIIDLTQSTAKDVNIIGNGKKIDTVAARAIQIDNDDTEVKNVTLSNVVIDFGDDPFSAIPEGLTVPSARAVNICQGANVNLVLENVTIDVSNDTEWSYAINLCGNTTGKVTLRNCDIKGFQCLNIYGYDIDVVVENCNFTLAGKDASSGSFITAFIQDGPYSGDASFAPDGKYAKDVNITIKDSTFTGSSDIVSIYDNKDSDAYTATEAGIVVVYENCTLNGNPVNN